MISRDQLSLCPSPAELIALIRDPDPSIHSLIAWCMYASGVVERDGQYYTRWIRGKHLVFLAQKLVDLYTGKIRRLAISFPPRHGKSRMVSQLGPGWWLGRDPKARVVVCSYSEWLARKSSRITRDVIGARGEEAFGVTANERAAASDWKLYRDGQRTGGGMRAVGRGGTIIGDDIDLLVVDDLYNADEVDNPQTRESVIEWWESVPFTRMEPWTKAIVMGTRWHHQDIIGWLQDRQRKGQLAIPWEHVNFPAIAEDDDQLDRPRGEPLWLERFGAEYYRELEAEASPYVWSAAYQGRPTPKKGSLFREAWLRSYRIEGEQLISDDLVIPLARLERFSTVDLAGSKKQRADYTVIATWGVDHQTRRLVLLDVVRERLEAPEIISTLREVQRRMRPALFYLEESGPQLDQVHRLSFAAQAGALVDPAAREQDVVLQRALAQGLPVRSIRPEKNKWVRAQPAAAVMKGGLILVPESAPWLSEWVSELLQFPQGRDDQVDTLSYAVEIYLEGVRRGGGPPDLGAAKPAPDRPTFPGAGLMQRRPSFPGASFSPPGSLSARRR